MGGVVLVACGVNELLIADTKEVLSAEGNSLFFAIIVKFSRKDLGMVLPLLLVAPISMW